LHRASVVAMWLLPTPGGPSTRNTRGAAGSSRASAIASATAASRRACSGRGVTPAGKCARRSSASVLPSTRISRRIVSWAYGGEADAPPAAVLGGRAGRRRAWSGADDSRARPAQPDRVDAAEGDARTRNVGPVLVASRVA